MPELSEPHHTPRHDPNRFVVERRSFVVLLVLVSVLFLWILWPFYGAVLWGTILAILFTPLYRRLLKRFRGHRNWAAIATLLIVTLIVVLPLTLLAGSLVSQTAAVYERVQSGELSFARYFDRMLLALPDWVTDLLRRFGIDDLQNIERRLLDGLSKGGQAVAMQIFSVGQNTLNFVVSFFVALYLSFFLIRDGAAINKRVSAAVPLDEEHKHRLARKFFTVIRATVKGNVLVAATQGLLGGLAFWWLGINGAMFWAVVMAFLSLLPAVGAGLVWLPVALYLLATGAVWSGVALVVYGVVVIGLVDNVLRPILVGKDTRMPDFLILLSTLGGMALFGVNGFVIGPAIAAMFLATWDMFTEVRAAQSTKSGD